MVLKRFKHQNQQGKFQMNKAYSLFFWLYQSKKLNNYIGSFKSLHSAPLLKNDQKRDLKLSVISVSKYNREKSPKDKLRSDFYLKSNNFIVYMKELIRFFCQNIFHPFVIQFALNVYLECLERLRRHFQNLFAQGSFINAQYLCGKYFSKRNESTLQLEIYSWFAFQM
ncbi:unnamed protein product [Paramecium octaurelia]|uniref:Uncharacterized protein n=1 Tax=Paramecium octaurelia TaxID=43137 RepID=A0A8S1T7R6_PAROT|nr:unnamed protein product [Paramecium octaurelia]